MIIKPIHTAKDHKAALAELRRLWDAQPGTAQHDKFEVLATLVEDYERRNVPILPPDPIEAIKFRLEQEGLTRKALVPLIGPPGRVSEILNGRRKLTLEMIRALHERFRIPLEALVAETKIKAAKGSRRSRAA